MKTFPQWLKRPMPLGAVEEMNLLFRSHEINTVCNSARCPNIGECFQNHEVTFMILGNKCTRNCGFCSVEHGIPEKPDQSEPYRIAKTVRELGLGYVVITSVTRDDLSLGGAEHFASTIEAIRRLNSGAHIEILTPDFNGDTDALKIIIESRPDVFSHNIETVPRLYEEIRPQASFVNSLSILKFVKGQSDMPVKSGFMLGLGETEEESIYLLKELKGAGVDIITIGQYLKPDKSCVDVNEFIEPARFEYFKRKSEEIGIPVVNAGPFVRSSYKAREIYELMTNDQFPRPKRGSPQAAITNKFPIPNYQLDIG